LLRNYFGHKFIKPLPFSQSFLKKLSSEPKLLESAFIDAENEGRVVNHEESVHLVLGPTPAGQMAWWKHYTIPPRRRLVARFARPRARREFAALHAFEQADLPVVSALAWCKMPGGGSLLVTEDIPGVADLFETIVRHPESDHTSLLQAIGRLAREIHDSGFGHFRMLLRNFLAKPGGVVALDLPYCCQWRQVAPARIRRIDLVDLAGANSGLSQEQAEVVLLAYAQDDAPPLSLEMMRQRRRYPQKWRRIAYYLLALYTGHRIRTP
jgi:hypothetical protein